MPTLKELKERIAKGEEGLFKAESLTAMQKLTLRFVVVGLVYYLFVAFGLSKYIFILLINILPNYGEIFLDCKVFKFHIRNSGEM